MEMTEQLNFDLPLFITFEGADGCGKTTQAERLANLLTEKGFDVFLTREPGDWSQGKKMRELLLHGKMQDPKSSLFMFMADRCEHVQQVLIPAMEMSPIVICDRYTDSTIAYQGYGKGNDIEFIKELNEKCGFPVPNATFYLAASQKTLEKRIAERQGRKDNYEHGDKEFLKNVIEGFNAQARENPDRIYPIDAENSPDVVTEDIWNVLWSQVPQLERTFPAIELIRPDDLEEYISLLGDLQHRLNEDIEIKKEHTIEPGFEIWYEQ